MPAGSEMSIVNNHIIGQIGPEWADSRDLIQVRDVIKVYKTAAGDFPALKTISLTVASGDFLGIVGKSGSGKSTLINMITGIDRPSKGEIIIGGVPIHAFNEGQMARWRGRNLGIVFQFFQLLPMLTAAENVMLPMDFCGFYRPNQRRRRALELLDLVGVSDQADKLPSTLSGGQQQRVAIARALANDPPIIMADEPTGNLDSRTSENIVQLFEKLVAAHKTIVMVTHDGEMAKRVHRTIIITDGELIEAVLSKAFHHLDESQLIRATAQLRYDRWQTGESVIRQGEPLDRLHIITRGEFEMRTTASSKPLAVLLPGEVIGESGVLRGGPASWTVISSAIGPSETISLDLTTASGILGESEDTLSQLAALDISRSRLNINSEGRAS
jgi:ABC-type lipoprotein export system ATPase subunit